MPSATTFGRAPAQVIATLVISRLPGFVAWVPVPGKFPFKVQDYSTLDLQFHLPRCGLRVLVLHVPPLAEDQEWEIHTQWDSQGQHRAPTLKSELVTLTVVTRGQVRHLAFSTPITLFTNVCLLQTSASIHLIDIR